MNRCLPRCQEEYSVSITQIERFGKVTFTDENFETKKHILFSTRYCQIYYFFLLFFFLIEDKLQFQVANMCSIMAHI